MALSDRLMIDKEPAIQYGKGNVVGTSSSDDTGTQVGNCCG